MTGDVVRCPCCGALHQSASADLWYGRIKIEEVIARAERDPAFREALIAAMADVDTTPYPRLPSLPWKPHEGPPHATPTEAIAAYLAQQAAKRRSALSRTEMTEEERADFVGDAKPS